VTPPATEIQTLIADIDSLLANKGNRLSRVLSNQGQEERKILENIRAFLANLAESQNQSLTQSNPSSEGVDFAAVLQPLHTEIQGLLQERKNLVEEIRHLEQQRLHNYSLAQQIANQEQVISEFLQALMSRVGGNIAPAIELTQPNPLPQQYITSPVESDEAIIPSNIPSQQELERIKRLAAELDQKLRSFDGSVNVVFEALQRNIHTYHDSLSEALLRMHSKGMQGEELLTSLIENWQQILHQNQANQASVAKSTPVDKSLESNLTTSNSAIASDLDTLLAELSQENNDEVDKLYASLFDTEVASVAPTLEQQLDLAVSENPKVAKIAVSEVVDRPIQTEPEVVEKTTLPETPNILENTTLPDPWEHKPSPNAEALAGLDTAEIENSWNAIALTDAAPTRIIVKPLEPANSEDIITSLAELLPEVLEPTIDPETAPENYVLASPQEDLLSQATAEIDAGMPDIDIDDVHLDQLEQDLSNFSGEEKPEAQILPSPADLELDALDTLDTQLILEDFSLTNPPPIAPSTLKSVWYLGVDLGTTGISATLLNRATTEIYPLFWSVENANQEIAAKRSFRLPAEVYLPSSASAENQNSQAGDATKPSLFSAELKPYLNVVLPYRKANQKIEPILQPNEVATVPLVWMVRSLSKLLLTLKSDRNSTTLGLTAAASGLNPDQFRQIIDNLAGVICSCPSGWLEQYRFNVREALLISKLVEHPQQVFFIEEAIASLLSELDGANGEELKIINRQGTRSAKSSETPLLGNTLVINIGAGATEMTLVDLPENLLELAHSDFMQHNFAYAGKGIRQDILCQLLLSEKWRESRNLNPTEATATKNAFHWQPSIPGLEQALLSSLELEQLALPRPGEPDVPERIRLQKRLESSQLGQTLLEAATRAKLVLQHQETFIIELADQRWTLHRRDLESQVFVPFVRRLNRELNRLLVARGIPTEAINQAVLTGGVASLAAVSRWLRQKLPNAKIIQHLYLDENGAPVCSRVAYGLSALPLHPQVLEIPRQQYTDYFLFTELLELLPERAISFGEAIQLFEARGINTRSCQQRLLAFLEGEIPAGLVPNSVDSMWLSEASIENPDYRAIVSVPLFEKQGSLTYRPNLDQVRSLKQYLDAIQGSTQQSLKEPYTVNFVIGAII
jgi:phosphate uptake regulator